MKLHQTAICAALLAGALSACGPSPAMLRYEEEAQARDERMRKARIVSEQRVDCMRNHRAALQIGMSQKEVLATCWNFVARTHRSEYADHISDQWVYEVYGMRVYAHFTDFLLTSISD